MLWSTLRLMKFLQRKGTLPYHQEMDDSTAESIVQAIDEHGEAQVLAAVDTLTCLSAGNAPVDWG